MLRKIIMALTLGAAVVMAGGVEAKTAEHPKVLLEPGAVKTEAHAAKTEKKKSALLAVKETTNQKSVDENVVKKPAFEDKRIEINLASKLLTLYQGDVGIRMYPIAPGKPSSPTPVGRRTVVDMEMNPTWIDPDSGVQIPSGPDCPLGYRWIGIGGNYGIHGTNAAYSIGSYASHGCVRMYEADVEDLFAHIVKGIPVDIIYERVVVQQEPNRTVAYYIYPDGYGREPLTVADVKKKLSPFGVASFADPDEVQAAIAASDGNPRYVARVYDLYVKGQKLDARAYEKGGRVYIPVLAVARAAGVKAEWSPNWKRMNTAYGTANGIQKGSAIYIDAADAPTLLHLTGALNEKYEFEMK